MGVRKTWILAGLLGVIGLCLSFHKLQQVQVSTPLKLSNPDQDKVQARIGAVQQVENDSNREPASSLTTHPGVDLPTLRIAQSKNEPWSSKYQIADTWTVQIKDESELKDLLESPDADFVEPVAAFQDVFVIRFQNSSNPLIAERIHARLEANNRIQWFEQEIIETFALRYDETPPPVLDPLLRDQWH